MNYESPKSRFQKSNLSKPHEELVKSEWLVESLDAALLQMQHQRMNAPTLGESSSNWLKLEGAREFIRIFLMLSDKQDPPKDMADLDNLKH